MRWTLRRQHRCGVRVAAPRGVEHVQCALPTGPDAHVVEICRAVGVGLGPFGEDGRTEARGRVHAAFRLGRPAQAGEVDLRFVVEGYLLRVEDHVLVHVEQEAWDPLELALPVVQTHEAVAEDDSTVDAVLADDLGRICRPLQYVCGVEESHSRLVDQTIEGDDVLVSVLSEELAELIVYFERAVRV